MGAIRAPLDLLGENLLYGFHRLNAILVATLARVRLRLAASGHSAVVIVLAILAPVENAAMLGMDILLRLGNDPCLRHLGLASNFATCLAGDFRSPFHCV